MQIQIELPSGHPLALAYAQAQIAARHVAFYDMLSREVLREIDALDMARDRCEALIEKLIEGLDEIAGDPDLEAIDEDGTDLDDGEGGDVNDVGELALGWTEREARTGRYQHNAQDDDEPMFGVREHGGMHGIPGTIWGYGDTSLKLDELEDENEHGGDVGDQGEASTWSEAGSLSGNLGSGLDDYEHALASTLAEDRDGVFSHRGMFEDEAEEDRCDVADLNHDEEVGL